MKRIVLLFTAALMITFLLSDCAKSPKRMAKKWVQAVCDGDEEAIKELDKDQEEIFKDMDLEDKKDWTKKFYEAAKDKAENVKDCKDQESIDEIKAINVDEMLKYVE